MIRNIILICAFQPTLLFSEIFGGFLARPIQKPSQGAGLAIFEKDGVRHQISIMKETNMLKNLKNLSMNEHDGIWFLQGVIKSELIDHQGPLVFVSGGQIFGKVAISSDAGKGGGLKIENHLTITFSADEVAAILNLILKTTSDTQ